MNLKWYLMLRIVLLAFLCLLVASGYVLWRAERSQQQQVAATVESLVTQIRYHLTTPMGFSTTGFDKDGRLLFWNPRVESDAVSGVCFRYVDVEGRTRATSCRTRERPNRRNRWNEDVPAWFSALYKAALNPERETVYPLSWNDRAHGAVIAEPGPTNKIAEAWHDVSALMGLTAVTVLALCILVYFVIGRALRPTREILRGLEQLEHGKLSTRLPTLELRELQKMSDGFNRLAASLEQSIAERTELTRKLVNVQEEERRYLARELHDELGQCLAAVKAIAVSVKQTAERQGSSLVNEGEKLAQISNHMMLALRNLLRRLRPPGIDDLGLVGTLESLIAFSGNGATKIEFEARGDFTRLPPAVTMGVYRIVQECLTNVSKHAHATNVRVTLARHALKDSADSIELTVEDNGKADERTLTRNPGMGLLGMRERVTALGGQLALRVGPTNGLVVNARIPMAAVA